MISTRSSSEVLVSRTLVLQAVYVTCTVWYDLMLVILEELTTKKGVSCRKANQILQLPAETIRHFQPLPGKSL